MNGPVMGQDCSPCALLAFHLNAGPPGPIDGLGGHLDLSLPLPSVATLSKDPFSAFHSHSTLMGVLGQATGTSLWEMPGPGFQP